MESLPTWVTVVLAIGGLLGGAFGTWLLTVYQARHKNKMDESKQGSEIKISENEQAFKIYKDLVDILRQDVKKMTEDMSRLEADYLKAREENATLRAENKNFQAEIDELKAEITAMKNKIT